MSDLNDNYRPPQPQDQGGDSQRFEGSVPDGTIVPAGMRMAPKPLSFGAAVAWCVAAGACASLSPIIAPLFVGFAYTMLACTGGIRERAIGAACLIVPAVVSVFFLRAAGYEDAVFACIVGITASELYLAGKLTPSIACMSVAILSAVLFGVSEVFARAAGTTVSSIFTEAMDLYLAQLADLPIEARSLVEQMRVIVNAIWPAAFVMIAFAGFILAVGGSKVAARRQGAVVAGQAPLDQFDLPLWMVGCLIAAIVILALSQAFPAYAPTLMMVGGTLLCSLRLAFATQGYAVLTWFRHNKRWYGLVGLAIIVIAVYLEFNMFVLTIVGILDIWANLRHLSRGVRVTIQDSTDRS